MTNDPLQNPYAPPASVPASVMDGPGAGRASDDPVSAYRDERRSVLLLVLLTVITVGIYPAVWFVRRRRFLDSRSSSRKLGVMAFAPLAFRVLSYVLAFAGISREARPVVSFVVTVVTLMTAFRVASILRSDFARTGRFLDVSGAGTFFFNALYLQHKINQAADTPARETTRADA